jgi:hypothetical protein
MPACFGLLCADEPVARVVNHLERGRALVGELGLLGRIEIRVDHAGKVHVK